MSIRLTVLFLWLLPGLVAAQGSISGTVRDSLTQKPLPFASVFLANTTLGATTNEQGAFVFERVPAGSYDVVASYVGYRLAKLAITMGQAPQRLDFKLAPTANQLGEVVVRPRPNRLADYLKFTELFLGRTTFSQQCRIRNPDDVLVDYDPATKELTAAARNFVQVDNQALGYRLKYYGLHFTCNFTQQIVTFYGQPVFEEMTPRNAHQQRRWQANRSAAYHGSLTHFLRSVYTNRVTDEGFVAQKLRIVSNPAFVRVDSARRQLLRARRKAVLTLAERDSLEHWAKVPPSFAMLYTAPRPIDSLRRVATGSSQLFLRFSDYLQVSYLREAPDPLYPVPASPFNPAPTPASRQQVSRLRLMVREAELQPNGQLVNPLAVFTQDYWGFEKIGEFLPLNYQPPAPSPTHDK